MIFKNWVIRILNCATEEEYDKLTILINEEIKIWCSQFEDKSKIPKNIIDVQLMLDKTSRNHNLTLEKFAIWERLKFSICRCSNHSESLHRVFNDKCNGKFEFTSRLIKMYEIILKKFTSQQYNHGRSIKERFKKLKAKFSELQKKGYNIERFTVNECNCGWNAYYTSLYGVRFPCIHEIGNHAFENCPTSEPLIETKYISENIITIVQSDENLEFPKHEKRNEDFGPLKMSDDVHMEFKELGPRATYAKHEMWKAINEKNILNR